MTDTLEPSKKVKTLRLRIYMPKYRNDMRLVNDALAEIQRECIALEIQRAELTQANLELTIAQMPNPNEEIAF